MLMKCGSSAGIEAQECIPLEAKGDANGITAFVGFIDMNDYLVSTVVVWGGSVRIEYLYIWVWFFGLLWR